MVTLTIGHHSSQKRQRKTTISKFELRCVVGLCLVMPQIKIHMMTFATGMCGLGFVPHTHTDDKCQRQRLGSVFAKSRRGGAPIGPSRNGKMFWQSQECLWRFSARFSKWRPLPMPIACPLPMPVVRTAVLATEWAQTEPPKETEKVTFKGHH